MNIILASDTYYPQIDGSSMFTQRLALYLKKAGHEVLVIAPSKKFGMELSFHNNIPTYGLRSLPLYIYRGLSLYASPVKRYKDLRFSPTLREKDELKRLTKEFNADIVHIQNHVFIGRTMFKVAQKLDLPVVATNHFMPENVLSHAPMLPDQLEKFAKSLIWKDFKKIYENVDIVTTPTQLAADVLHEIGLKKEVSVISNGIDTTVFKPNNEYEYLYEKYNLPRVPILLFVSRLDKEKNIPDAINAVEKVKNLPFHFAIGGKGVLHDDLQALIKKKKLTDKVSLLGFIPDEDLPPLHALADVFIMPGTAELQSISTMEAMASGSAVIAADAVALPELVKYKQNGFLCEPHNIDDYAAAISTLFTDETLRDEYGKESLKIIQKHRIENIIDTFVHIYDRAIKEHQPAPNPSLTDRVSEFVSRLNPL